jgi:hypothetical protein
MASRMKMISDKAEFYFITCEPGEDIYARFGHTGLRICDSTIGIDLVAHWGLFSFETPNFVGKFILGETDYQMGIFETKYFLQEYVNRGSSVYAQQLNLTYEQKKELWLKLWENYKPENRTYRYNFIYNNCATRPFHLILSILSQDGKIKNEIAKITYRDIINSYISINSGYNLGINLIIGSEADNYITKEQSVSFPLYAMQTMDDVILTEDNSSIVTNTHYLFQSKKVKDDKDMGYWVILLIPIVITTLSLFYTCRKKRYIPFITHCVLIISGMVGLVIGFLWFMSQHPLVNNNINLLWCNPLNIILAILLPIHAKSLRMTKIVLSSISILFSIERETVFSVFG